MTAAPHLTEPEAVRHLIGRDDLTVDDIADLPEDLRYELIDGRLVLSPLAFPFHQFLSMEAGVAIREHRPDGYYVNIEQALLVGRQNELRPDVVVVKEEAAFSSPVLPGDVPLVVEVLSKSTKKFDLEGKREKYFGVRVPSYWIVDPLGERVTFTQFVLGEDGKYDRRLHTDELVTVDVPWKITLDLPSWTRDLQRARWVARHRT